MIRVLFLLCLILPSVSNAKLRYYHKTDALEKRADEFDTSLNDLRKKNQKFQKEITQCTSKLTENDAKIGQLENKIEDLTQKLSLVEARLLKKIEEKLSDNENK